MLTTGIIGITAGIVIGTIGGIIAGKAVERNNRKTPDPELEKQIAMEVFGPIWKTVYESTAQKKN